MGMIERKKSILLNTPHIVTASGSVASFDTDVRSKLKECKLYFSPVQADGTPSPDNVLPISGWDGLTVYKTGKNIIARTLDQVKAFTPTRWTGNVYNYNNLTVSVDTDSDGNILGYNCTKSGSSGTGTLDIALYKTLSGKTVKLSGSVAGGASGTYRLILQEFAPENKVLAREYSAGSTTVTIPKDATDVRIRIAITGEYSDLYFKPMLTVVDETDLTYSSPNPTTIPITFPSEAGTLYGGYVDFASGELVVTHEYLQLDAYTDCNEFRIQSNGLYTVWSLISTMKSGRYAVDKNTVCDKAIKVGARADIPNTQLGILIGNNNQSIYLYNMDTVYGLTTKEQISAWLDENPLHVTLPINAPLTYQLTPQQIKTLIGRNNIWSDANGDIEVKYWKH